MQQKMWYKLERVIKNVKETRNVCELILLLRIGTQRKNLQNTGEISVISVLHQSEN